MHSTSLSISDIFWDGNVNYTDEDGAKQEGLIQKTLIVLTNFIEITSSQRHDGDKTDFLAADGLHPSGKEYAKWAVKLSDAFLKEL